MSEVEGPDLAAYVTRRGFDLRSHSFGNGSYGIAAVEAGGKQQSPGLARDLSRIIFTFSKQY